MLGAAAFVVAAAGLQGCQQPQVAAPPPAARQYAIDQQGGAKLCTVPKETRLTDGKETPAAMTVGNDGGWCAIDVARDGEPYSAGLLILRPTHGQVYIHTVGDNTRIDYTPRPGYAGPDSFTARMIPGDATLRVSVTVAGTAAAPAPPPPPPPAPAKHTPAKRPPATH